MAVHHALFMPRAACLLVVFLCDQADNFGMRAVLFAASLVLLACAAGCSGSPAPATQPTPACRTPSPITPWQAGFPLVEGRGSGVSLWGIVMTSSRGPAQVGEEVKIVWRMTGSGPLTLLSIAPDGRRAPLEWGPVMHDTGSTFNKPGDEWGAGYVFNSPGCWDLRAIRGSLHADVLLTVVRSLT
jgi:hypothetical protein